MKLLYSQPKAEDIGGTHLCDHPWLLVNNAGQLVAWNERGGSGSSAVYQNNGYDVTYERDNDVGGQIYTDMKQFHQPSEPLWAARDHGRLCRA